MLRYIAFAWDAADVRQAQAVQVVLKQRRATLPSWQVCLQAEGLAVLCADAQQGSGRACAISTNSGVVVGTLFSRPDAAGSAQRKLTLSAAESHSIIASEGRELLERYWGRYVAFLIDKESGRRRIVRDPTGGLPCMRASWQGIHVFFSLAADFVELGLIDCTINWQFVSYRTLLAAIESRETCLNEIVNVAAGECARIDGDTVSIDSYWHPFKVAADRIADFGTAASLLRGAGRSCVHSWASCFESILVRLSGGLDSSTVACLLGSAPNQVRVTPVNYYAEGADEDERAYARIVARHAHFDLTERKRSPLVGLEGMLKWTKSERPNVTITSLEILDWERDLARRLHATGVFNGTGGDQAFYTDPVSTAAADYLYERGLRPSFFGVALDMAYRARLSVWKVMAEAFDYRFFGRKWNPSGFSWAHARLVNPEIIASLKAETALHPWFLASESRPPPGKLWHIHFLTAPMPSYDPMEESGDAELVHPLNSQPVIEICLRTPTYLLCRDGRDRALAREAFSDQLPREIVERMTKGGMDVHAKRIFENNFKLVREVLLDGELIRRGILDRGKVEEVLTPGRPSRGVIMSELFNYFVTEGWLQGWISQAPSCAARGAGSDLYRHTA